MATERKQPLLTIAVPTYNGANTIRSMMDILLPQVDFDKIEILVSDNGSTDDTPAIIQEYIAQYPQICCHRHEKNIGADGNFLYCMQAARGRFAYLLSDDDILMPGKLSRILSFLESHPDTSLIFLSTVNFYVQFEGLEKCKAPVEISDEDIYTADKRIFMRYARHYWGFLSSFIISTEAFGKIDRPEQYFGTYWLQSYIHILCSAGDNAHVGVVGSPCVAAGVYVNQSNFDTAFVDGVQYRKMLDFAIENAGYPKKQLDRMYIRRLCLLASHGLIKEKATGNKKINKKLLFCCTWNYPLAWIKIYPAMLVPSFICRVAMKFYRKLRKCDDSQTLNRAGDVASE